MKNADLDSSTPGGRASPLAIPGQGEGWLARHRDRRDARRKWVRRLSFHLLLGILPVLCLDGAWLSYGDVGQTPGTAYLDTYYRLWISGDLSAAGEVSGLITRGPQVLLVLWILLGLVRRDIARLVVGILLAFGSSPFAILSTWALLGCMGDWSPGISLWLFFLAEVAGLITLLWMFGRAIARTDETAAPEVEPLTPRRTP